MTIMRTFKEALWRPMVKGSNNQKKQAENPLGMVIWFSDEDVTAARRVAFASLRPLVIKIFLRSKELNCLSSDRNKILARIDPRINSNKLSFAHMTTDKLEQLVSVLGVSAAKLRLRELGSLGFWFFLFDFTYEIRGSNTQSW